MTYDDWKLCSPYDEPAAPHARYVGTVTIYDGAFAPPPGHPAPDDADVQWSAAPGDEVGVAEALVDGVRVGPTWEVRLDAAQQAAVEWEAEEQARGEWESAREDAAEARAERERES